MDIRERSRGNGVPVMARGCRTLARAVPAHHARRRSRRPRSHACTHSQRLCPPRENFSPNLSSQYPRKNWETVPHLITYDTQKSPYLLNHAQLLTSTSPVTGDKALFSHLFEHNNLGKFTSKRVMPIKFKCSHELTAKCLYSERIRCTVVPSKK